MNNFKQGMKECQEYLQKVGFSNILAIAYLATCGYIMVASVPFTGNTKQEFFFLLQSVATVGVIPAVVAALHVNGILKSSVKKTLLWLNTSLIMYATGISLEANGYQDFFMLGSLSAALLLLIGAVACAHARTATHQQEELFAPAE